MPWQWEVQGQTFRFQAKDAESANCSLLQGESTSVIEVPLYYQALLQKAVLFLQASCHASMHMQVLGHQQAMRDE